MVQDLLQTPLLGLHQELGAKMVPFAGFAMPVQYAAGVMQEHKHTRDKAGLFDVSHMGQVIIRGDDYATAARALEALIPIDILSLAPQRQRYGFFTSADGGILDDLMLANRGDHIFMVVNAARKAQDLAHLTASLGASMVDEIEDRALLALQGPMSEKVLRGLNPAVSDMKFMDVATLTLQGVECWISRSGYSGEDGFEISVPANAAEALARALLEHEDVLPIGLGARDSLRLEAGLCLYGHDMDTSTNPIEASLAWAIQSVRRAGGQRAGGFAGESVIFKAMSDGPAKKRVGLRPEGRAPMREGVELFASESSETPIGSITSGGFGPTVGGPVAMGYVQVDHSAPGTRLWGELRGKRLPVTVARLPFVSANFKR